MRRYVRAVLVWQARRRLLSHRGVSVDPSAKMNWRGVRWVPGCELVVGPGSMVEGTVAFERPGARVSVGANSFVGGATLACATSLTIGNDVLVAWGTTIVDHNSHSLSWGEREHDVRDWYDGKKDWTHVPMKPVIIGNRAWIGLHVIVLKGVTIGEGAVVGAGSVVTKDVPPWTVVAGNPARVVRELRPEAARGPNVEPTR